MNAPAAAQSVWVRSTTRPAPTDLREVCPEPRRVSIVIPAFNAERYLPLALASLRRQTWRDWEALIVDDGSTDRTVEVAAAAARRDSRFRLLSQPNAGVSRARNTGLQAARAEWLVFLDADDVLQPRALQLLLSQAQREPDAEVVLGRSQRIDRSGHAWKSPTWDLGNPFELLAYECGIVIHSALVRRQAVEAVGGFDETLRSAEDWDLWQRIARTGARFAQIDEVVASYRSTPGSLSKDISQLVRDTLAVMARGVGPDPRVPRPDPRHRAGAPAEPLKRYRLNFVLWSAARDIARGGDGLEIFELLETQPDLDADPEDLAEMLATGMADFLSVQPHALADRWSEHRPRLEALLTRAFPGVERGRFRELVLVLIANRFGVSIEGFAGSRLHGATLMLSGQRRLDPPGRPTALQLWLRGPLGVVALTGSDQEQGDGWRAAVVAQAARLPLRQALAAGIWRSPGFLVPFAARLMDPRKAGLRLLLRGPRWQLRAFLAQRVRHASRAALAAFVARRLAAAPVSPAGQAEGASAADPLLHPRQTGRAAAWDRIYERDDPWGYASAYEQEKYQLTLELVPAAAGRVLELGCAQGHFTRMLAPRADELIAADISQAALEGAARRCAGYPNVRFSRLDLAADDLPGQLDCVICSEVLYYLSPDAVAKVAHRIAASLRPAGLLVMANANQLADEPAGPSYDWGHEIGSRTVGEIVAATPGLRLQREIRTPLYRVQAFVKGPVAAPLVEDRPLESELEPRLARDVVWSPGASSRVAAHRRELSLQLPILMYHRIARSSGLTRFRVRPADFERQVELLRHHGYWSPSTSQWAAALAMNRPLSGRPVLFTFDDGYADFIDIAWPILKKHGFGAVVFPVADAVGGGPRWESPERRRPRLMSWADLRTVHAEGVEIGSHSLTHPRLSRLDLDEVRREVAQSRDVLQEQLGVAPTAFCYPYGIRDALIERIVAECGFRLGFSCTPGVSRLSDNPLKLRRIEINGYDNLTTFARKVLPGTPPPG